MAIGFRFVDGRVWLTRLKQAATADCRRDDALRLTTPTADCSTVYIELHASSAFSFLDGASLPEALVDRAAALGYPALALLDRDGVYGAPRFHLAAKRAGLEADHRRRADGRALGDRPATPMLPPVLCSWSNRATAIATSAG